MSKQSSELLTDHLKWLEELPPGRHGLFTAVAERLVAEHPAMEISQAKQKFGRLAGARTCVQAFSG